jgi:hypothetical protein
MTTIMGQTPGMQRPRELEVHPLAGGYLQLQVQRPGRPDTGWAIRLDPKAVQKLHAILGAMLTAGAASSTTKR